MQTQVPAGSPLARKVFGAALFAKVVAASSLIKNLTGEAPKQSDAEAKLKGQTVPDMPVVRVTDLSKSAGDTVSVDAFDTITGKPIMGDANAEGRGSSLSSSSMDISINNTTKVVDAGGKMAQQRTVHQLRGIAMAQLQGYFPRLHTQAGLVHLAGARGSQTGKDWIVPSASDPDFSSIMINTIKAPTYNRHLVVNGASFTVGGQQLGSIASTDLMTLAHIDELSVLMSDHNMGLQPVRLSDDPAADDDPIKAVWYMTERQWNNIKTSNSYQTAVQQAWARKSYGTKHPLFSGEPIMWNGILVRKMPKFAIRFAASENTNIITAANRYTATESVQAVSAITAGYAVERSLVLGAQALAYVFGKNAGSDTGFNWLENLYNFERNLEVGGESMGGMSKLRFTFDDGAGNMEPTDNGVFVVDSAVKL